MTKTELEKLGWYLTDDGFAKCSNEGKLHNNDIIAKKALDFDLKEVGDKWLPDDLNKGRVDCLEGPAVLQLTKLRVVSAPKDNQESQTAPRLCRIWLTDGHSTCSGVTLEAIKGIGTNTPPGSKVLVSGPVEVEGSFLLFNAKNARLLGGDVESISSAWELKKSLAQQTLTRNNVQSEGGPPPFVPFGTKINRDDLMPSTKDFKSLNVEKEKDSGGGDDEFSQQRQATIQQALQAKSSGQGGKASFGGGPKQFVKDQDIARIMEMGFSSQEASNALKSTNGNLQDAINYLVTGSHRGNGGRGGFNSRGTDRGGFSGRGSDRGKGSRGGHNEGRTDRRRGRDRDNDDDDDYAVHRPSGPAKLSDFLDASKLFSKPDSKKNEKASASSKEPEATNFTSSSSTTNSASTANNNYSSSKSAYSRHSENNRPNASQGFSSSYDSSRNRPSSGYHHKDNSGGYQNKPFVKNPSNSGFNAETQPDRRQHTTIPPRFAKNRKENYDKISQTGTKDFASDKITDQQKDTSSSSSSKHSYENNNPYHNRRGFSNSFGRQDESNRYNSRNQRPTVPDNRNRNPDFSTSYEGFNKKEYDKNTTPSQSNNSFTPSYDSRNSYQHYSKPNNQYYNVNEKKYNNHSNAQDSQQQQHFNNGYGYNNSRNNNSSFSNSYHSGYGDQSQNQHHQQSSSGSEPYQPRPYQDKQFDGAKEGRNENMYQIGDIVMARYWEDKRFYPASVEAIGPQGATVIVHFVEYGNTEEVYIRDVQPMQGRPPFQPRMGGGPRMYGANFDPAAFANGGQFVPPMQFSRRQEGNFRDGNQRRQPVKPTQQFYSPPNFKR